MAIDEERTLALLVEYADAVPVHDVVGAIQAAEAKVRRGCLSPPPSPLFADCSQCWGLIRPAHTPWVLQPRTQTGQGDALSLNSRAGFPACPSPPFACIPALIRGCPLFGVSSQADLPKAAQYWRKQLHSYLHSLFLQEPDAGAQYHSLQVPPPCRAVKRSCCRLPWRARASPWCAALDAGVRRR